MKHLNTLLLFVFCALQAHAREAHLVVTLMVKNEAPVICQTLQPFVDAGVERFLIFDTGSTDDTVALTQQFFTEHQIDKACIKQEPFVDFATSRNRALDLTEEHFPEADFILMPDAEWYLHNVEQLVQFCHDHLHESIPCYLVRILNPHLDFYQARLIRCHSPIRFVGVVHEVLSFGTLAKVPEEVFFELGCTRYGQEKSQRRWIRDRELLEAECMRHPNDPRTVFYLAQTCACLGDWPSAQMWYEKRIMLQGWDEENYMAHYKLALVYLELQLHDKAVMALLNAFSMRPHRVEPLVRLAHHYWSMGNHALCFLFARRAAEIPYPHNDLLFIEKGAYDFVRYDLLGRSSWYVQEFEIGEKAVLAALQKYPDKEYVRSNLQWYLNRHAPAAQANT